ncbi:MAG TPA: hypothetical protein VIV40_10610 [Kofleriaceae bacterium]
MPSLTLFLQHLGLALRLAATHPQLDTFDAFAHAEAATIASTPQISAELLIAIAYVESRFDPLALSRVEGKHRRLGHYGSDQAPARLRKGSSLYCGPLQTFASTWSDCVKQRELEVAYKTGAMEIGRWLRDRRVRGDMTLALAGYGCGNRGVRTGKCNRYPGRVLWQAKRLEAAKPITIASRS